MLEVKKGYLVFNGKRYSQLNKVEKMLFSAYILIQKEKQKKTSRSWEEIKPKFNS